MANEKNAKKKVLRTETTPDVHTKIRPQYEQYKQFKHRRIINLRLHRESCLRFRCAHATNHRVTGVDVEICDADHIVTWCDTWAIVTNRDR